MQLPVEVADGLLTISSPPPAGELYLELPEGELRMIRFRRAGDGWFFTEAEPNGSTG